MSIYKSKSGRNREEVNTPLYRFFEKYGYTDSYLSSVTGYHRNTVATFVRNPSRVKVDFLQKLSVSLGVDIQYLLDLCTGEEDIELHRNTIKDVIEQEEESDWDL